MLSELDLDDADAYINRAELFKGKGELDQAYLNLTMAHQSKADVDRAIADYSKAIELNPDDTSSYYNRAIAYESKGEFDRAIADRRKGIELEPDAPEPDAPYTYLSRAQACKDKVTALLRTTIKRLS